jgi:hypothetical protein
LCDQYAYLEAPTIVNGEEELDAMARVLIHDPNPYVYGINEPDEPPEVFQNCAYTLISVQQVNFPPPPKIHAFFRPPPSFLLLTQALQQAVDEHSQAYKVPIFTYAPPIPSLDLQE